MLFESLSERQCAERLSYILFIQLLDGGLKIFLLYFSMNYRDFSVKSKLIISLFQTVKLSLSISLFQKIVFS